jgi:hypothetical protein
MREVSAISGRGEQKSNDKAFISTHVSRGPISIFMCSKDLFIDHNYLGGHCVSVSSPSSSPLVHFLTAENIDFWHGPSGPVAKSALSSPWALAWS